MTLDKDTNDGRKFRGNNRAPMKSRTTIIVVIVAALVLGFAITVAIVSGKSFF